MAVDRYIARAGHAGEEPRQTSLLAVITDLARAISGVALGLAAILLPAVIWQNIESLYASFGAPVFVVMLAPIAILVRTYGRPDDAD